MSEAIQCEISTKFELDCFAHARNDRRYFISKNIKLNKEYQIGQLSSVNPDPYVQFDLWFNQACATMPDNLVNCMVLSTVSNNQPSTRIVLLKEYDANGFIFYTNYLSRKGQEIAQNPSVSLLFWWEALERQVRIEGIAEKIPVEKSAAYFHSRPKSSQIAALASKQSQPLPHLADLQNRYQQLCAEYAGAEVNVPHPDHWGGYVVKPERFEYWQGRESRLHDRFQYTRNAAGQWTAVRLFP